jgi:diguanylate cyclase (GGDEF)-like protein/PAS domain S-box-containing protein
MLELAVLGVSAVLQFVAAFLAIRLTGKLGGLVVWGSLSAALLLMAIRRSLTLKNNIVSYPDISLTLSTELVVLLISVLMLFAIGAIHPIFRRFRESKEALRDSERRFRALSDTSTSPTFVLNDHFIYANPAGLSLLGYNLEELRGMRFLDVVAEDDHGECAALRKRLLEAGDQDSSKQVIRMIDRDRQVHWIESTCSRIVFDGQVAVLSTGFDISESRKAVEALRQSEERFSKAFHASPVMISIYRVSDGLCVDVNDTFLDRLGYRRESVVGHYHADNGVWAACPECNDLIGLLDIVGMGEQVEAVLHAQSDETLQVVISVEQIELDNEPCVLVMCRDISDVRREQLARMDREKGLIRQQQALLELSHHSVADRQDMQALLEKITRTAAHTLNVDRVSVWLLDEARGMLSCEVCYELSVGMFVGHDDVSCDRLGDYCRFLSSNLVLAVEDVDKDPRVQDSTRDILFSGTHSLIDASVRISNKLVGKLSLEQLGRPRQWPIEVQNFAATLAEMVALAIDEQQRIDTEQELHREKELAQITVDSIGDGVITTDTDGFIEFMNPVAEDLCGWQEGEALGVPLMKVIDLVDESSRKPVLSPVTECINQGRNIRLQSSMLLINHANSREYAVEVAVSQIRGSDNVLVGMVLVFHDVTELRGMAQKMSYQASHDSLTGLLNRREFERQLESALDSAREQGRRHAVCYLDLDQFKVVNDTCGHVAGDELLRQLSLKLSAVIRDSDTLARLGGDEFGILLDACPIDRAREICLQILELVRDFRFAWQDKIFEIGVSIGLVPVSADSGNLTDVLSAADSACYVAKDHGRNRIHIFQQDDKALAQHHGDMLWMQRIQQALSDDRFVLHLQMIQPLKTGRKHQYHGEFLLRMLDEDGNLVSPGYFMPAAERYHLMPSLDRWVVRRAFEHIAIIRKQSDIAVFSINLSGQSLNDEKLMKFIIDLFDETQVSPDEVCFEITETAVIANLAHATIFIEVLQGMGCRFALDDFGSGLSSFAYLKSLPVDYLKIDGHFVRYMVRDDIDRAMVDAINHIGHVMGIQTIAEFVEDEETLEGLRALGVDYAQGYVVARPVEITDLPALREAQM